MRRPNPLSPDHTHPEVLDRGHLVRRDPEAIGELRRHPEVGYLVVWRERSLVIQDGAGTIPALLGGQRPDQLLATVEATDSLTLLGLDRGEPRFVIDLSHHEDPFQVDGLRGLESQVAFEDLRQLAPVLSSPDGNLLAYARAMTTWHRRHRFCGQCGSPTHSRDGGHVRDCSDEACGLSTFPRTDSAVIMLVHDGGTRCLLGRQANWPEGVFSTLAGFVEPGENLEHAVAREVQEEVGVRVDEVHYHSSQPWPFPSSIMLGFWTRAITEEITLDPKEIDQARWFERDELVELQASHELRLPPKMSISRRLVDDWLDEG